MTETGNDRRLAAVWRDAKVMEVRHHGDLAVILRLDVPDRVIHRPGQHYVVRLRAEDGYTASRSYSTVSAPSDDDVELYVERVPDGEVSGFLAEGVEAGDELEVRGPIGRWFAWDGRSPALGIGGGSGVAPLVSMLRHARDVGRPELLSLAVSARTAAALPYREELEARRRARGAHAGERVQARRGRGGRDHRPRGHRVRVRFGTVHPRDGVVPAVGRAAGGQHPGRAVRTQRRDRGERDG